MTWETKTLRSGLDRLELYCKIEDEKDRKIWASKFSPRPDFLENDVLPMLKFNGSGGRNFALSYSDEESGITLLTQPRSEKQQKDCGDIKLEFLQKWLWRRNDRFINAPGQEAIDEINLLLVSLGINLNRVKIARVDFCCDVTADDAHKWRFPSNLIRTRSRNFKQLSLADLESWREWEETHNPMSDSQIYTGFRMGNDSGVGQGMLRVYRKDIELQGPKSDGDIIYYAADHDLDVDDMPAIWRVEQEMRGKVLTEHKIRDWLTFPDWRPAILKRLAGLEVSASPIPYPDHTGYRIIQKSNTPEKSHRLWRAVEDNAKAIDNGKHIEKLKHERHFYPAINEAKKNVQKALERLYGMISAGEKQSWIEKINRATYEPVIDEDEVTRRTRNTIKYFGKRPTKTEGIKVDVLKVIDRKKIELLEEEQLWMQARDKDELNLFNSSE